MGLAFFSFDEHLCFVDEVFTVHNEETRIENSNSLQFPPQPV